MKFLALSFLGWWLIIFPGTGPAKAIDLSDREVPLAVLDNGVLTGTLESRYVSASPSLYAKPYLTPQNAMQSYALFVPDTAATTVTINGDRLAVLPLDRGDGLVYMVDPMYLQAGGNTIRLDRDSVTSWNGLALFSLRDSIEEAHFAEAFSESASIAEPFSSRDIQPSALQTNYDVLWYDCTWVPSISAARMEAGSEVIMGARTLVDNVQSIELDFDRNFNGNGGSPMTISYVDSGPGTAGLLWDDDPANFRLRIHLSSPLPAGSDFKVRVGYYGAPNSAAPSELFNTNPMYASTTGAGRPVVYSVSQPYGGRRWWPSKDHPSDKATTTTQRIIVPKTSGYTLTAISNGTLEGVSDLGTNLMYTWKTNHPIATYLMSFAVSDYVYRGDTYTSLDGQTTMPVGHWIYPENVGIEGTGYAGTLQVMNFFADKFGEYPFLEEKYQTATWNISYAIEHQTATSMPAGITGGVGNGLTRRNIHELAHQWFGNKVTCSNWDHTWLNEGFATYCEALAFEHLSGRPALFGRMNELSPSTQLPVVGPDSQNFRSSTVYHKGAWVLHMLRYVLGDEAFFQALRDYAAAGYTTSVSQPPGAPVDLQSTVEQSAGFAPGALGQFFTQWLYSPNGSYAARPDYTFSAAYDVQSTSVNVVIGQHQGGTAFHMPIDVLLTSADSQTTMVRVPMGNSQATFPLVGFVPVSAQFDPENWIFKRRRASIITSSLPTVAPGGALYFVLQGDSDAGGLSWQKLPDTPAWVSVSSSGVITGTAPSAGIYPVSIRLTDAAGATATARFDLMVIESPPPPPVVINELLYENYEGADTAEYIELKNNGTAPVDISGWKILLVNGSTGEATNQSVTLPQGSIISASGYFVVGNNAAMSSVFGVGVNYNTGWSESLQDGAPDAVLLMTDNNVRIDSIVYRADSSFAAGSLSALVVAEGGTGRGLSRGANNSSNAVLARLPDGQDTGSNLVDFAMAPPSPGTMNSSGVSLPLVDDFENGARPEWKPAFDGPIRTVAPGQAGKPAVASPAGGNVLEVFDRSGGGDVVYLPGDFNQLNVEGYLWIPQNAGTAGWSTGVGIGTRVESAWFSSTSGFGMEHGFYLEYQNGTFLNLKGSRIPNAQGAARLIAANSTDAQGAGIAGFTSVVLGSVAVSNTGVWHPFRIYFDGPRNKLHAELNNLVIYDGSIPAGFTDVSGGVAVGFRENHGGVPDAANREGTWVDAIRVNDNTNSSSHIMDFMIY